MGPSPDLSLLDGRPVAQATWLFDDASNHGFDYSLPPPEILGPPECARSA